MNKADKRSPLREKPLRLPGQSLTDQIADLNDEMVMFFMFPVTLIAYPLGEWINSVIVSYLPKSEPQSGLVTFIGHTIAIIIFLGFIGYCIYRFVRALRKRDLLIMARDGEKIVAEELLPLIQKGAVAFHDIIGEKFNIDHVIVSKHGIYLLETKTFSKPIKNKDAHIRVVNNEIHIDGHKPDRNPIEQAKALAKWLQNVIKKSTGKSFPVTPVVIFPGWFVETYKSQEYWVINPKNALPTFITNEPVTINENDLHLITYHLSRYIKS